jgi:hypothetical protein
MVHYNMVHYSSGERRFWLTCRTLGQSELPSARRGRLSLQVPIRAGPEVVGYRTAFADAQEVF